MRNLPFILVLLITLSGCSKVESFLSSSLMELIGSIMDYISDDDIDPAPKCSELIPCEDHDYTRGLERKALTLKEHWSYIDGKPYEQVLKSYDETWVLVQTEQYLVLEAYLEEIQSKYESGEIDEFVYLQAMERSGWNTINSLPLIDNWIKQTGSAFAHQSKGLSLKYIGNNIRGTKWASETPPENLIAYRQYLSQSYGEFSKALEMNPKLVVSYQGIIGVIKGTSDFDVTLNDWVRRLEQHVPQAFYPRLDISQMLQPRWGGSYSQMRAFAEDSQRFVELNSRMRVLLGTEWADRGNRLKRNRQYREAIDAYSKALYHAQWTTWLTSRAYLYWQVKEWENMKSDAVTILKIFPQDYWGRIYSGISSWHMGQHEAADEAFKKAVDSQPYWAVAWYWWGRHDFDRENYATAKEKLEKAIANYPRQQDYYFWYARTLDKMNDEKAVNVFRDYLSICSSEGEKCESQDMAFARQRLSEPRSIMHTGT